MVFKLNKKNSFPNKIDFDFYGIVWQLPEDNSFCYLKKTFCEKLDFVLS